MERKVGPQKKQNSWCMYSVRIHNIFRGLDVCVGWGMRSQSSKVNAKKATGCWDSFKLCQIRPFQAMICIRMYICKNLGH